MRRLRTKRELPGYSAKDKGEKQDLNALIKTERGREGLYSRPLFSLKRIAVAFFAAKTRVSRRGRKKAAESVSPRGFECRVHKEKT